MENPNKMQKAIADFVLECALYSDKEAVINRKIAQFGCFLLKESILEFVKQNPGMSTTKIDENLEIDASTGGSGQNLTYTTLKTLEKQRRVKCEKLGKETQWFISEHS